MFNPRKADNSYSSNLSTPVETPEVRDYSATQAAITNGNKSSSSNHSIVDARLTMRGDLESDGDILVKGKVIGNIKCKVLIVDTDALVEGGIEAEEVVIRGKTTGAIVADRVRLERTADVDSEISQKTFMAEEGARIKGTLKMKQDTASGSGIGIARAA